ncbi:SusD/RagB family nutrient-binding outer membrane lipoprotein [Zunongwangia sp. H14]|uniref:SusD/RagB family nutrient-binding outer membrane lipoprotein n=1 Tax=Zunongwangia sp. H14 TaxID=3240792 RepID=UPI0035636A35
MKRRFIIFAAVFSVMCGAVSCEDQLDINRDPDSLSQGGVAMATEFPAAITGIVGAQGSYGALVGGFWSQYWTQSNASNQYKSLDDYSVLGTSDYSNSFWFAMFDALGDARNVKRIALEQENWNYYLAATTLEVYASQIMVDFFGAIPYEEANNASILQPHFNTGEEVYDLLIEDLNSALSHDLEESQGNAPAADDLLFGGNMENWVAFANTLKLKIFLRQQNARPQVAQSGINDLLNSGVEFLDTDAAMTQFEDAPNKSNPLYETNERQLNSTTNLRASTTMFSFLDSNGDPRLSEYYEPGNPLNQGDFNSTVAPNSIAIVDLSPTTPVYLMSREESLFLQAEAQLRYGSEETAEERYNAGVIEALSKYGIDGAPFVAEGGVYAYPEGSQMENLESIITQRWVAAFPGNGFEAFFAINRTGIPAVSEVSQDDENYIPGELAYPVNGTTGGDFPKRLPFPSNVRARNTNAPDIVDITVPVWWAE